MKLMPILTDKEKEMLKMIAEDPELVHKPTELAKRMGWKKAGAAATALRRLKKKIKKIKEAYDYINKLGIKIEEW